MYPAQDRHSRSPSLLLSFSYLALVQPTILVYPRCFQFSAFNESYVLHILDTYWVVLLAQFTDPCLR